MNPLPQIVRQRLAALPGESHPDSNLLCAFAEKSLDPHENEQVISHLAVCSDCRTTVVLAQPETPPSENIGWIPSATPSLWAGMRWAVWAACAVVVGVALTLYQREQTIHSQIAKTTPPITQPVPANEKGSVPVEDAARSTKPSPSKELASAEEN